MFCALHFNVHLILQSAFHITYNSFGALLQMPPNIPVRLLLLGVQGQAGQVSLEGFRHDSEVAHGSLENGEGRVF